MFKGAANHPDDTNVCVAKGKKVCVWCVNQLSQLHQVWQVSRLLPLFSQGSACVHIIITV